MISLNYSVREQTGDVMKTTCVYYTAYGRSLSLHGDCESSNQTRGELNLSVMIHNFVNTPKMLYYAEKGCEKGV